MSGNVQAGDAGGTSSDSYEQAIQNAIQDASASLRNLSCRGDRAARPDRRGSSREYQAKIQAGFKVEIDA